MARTNLPIELKRRVLVEAGHRCAIPTCRDTTTEIAHIVRYSKVKDHTFDNLIALCPNCHTRFDKGDIDAKSILIYKSNLSLTKPLSSTDSDFNITLWSECNDGLITYFVDNHSKDSIMDFVLYIDKIDKTEEESTRSRHTVEAVFGTIPPNKALTYSDDGSYLEDDAFGFPILTGQFTDKSGNHWEIDRLNSISRIKFRASFS
jgi:hypothetical protein